MNRVFVFIDGGNFYFKLKEIKSNIDGKHSLLDFPFRQFTEYLDIGISKGQSLGLSKVTDDVRLLRPEEIKTIFKKPGKIR